MAIGGDALLLRARSLPGRVDERLFIQRPERPRIHDLGADVVFIEELWPAPRATWTMPLVATSVMSLPSRLMSATPNGISVVLLGHRTLELVHHLVFEEDDRVVVADGGFQQTLGIVGRRGQQPP